MAVCVAVRVVLVMFAWPYLRQPNWMDILSIREGVDDVEKATQLINMHQPALDLQSSGRESSKCV